MSLLSRMNRYFVREGETETCPALKVHVLSFAFLPSDSATDVILVCRSANSMGKHRPHKKASQVQDGKFEFLCLFIAVER